MSESKKIIIAGVICAVGVATCVSILAVQSKILAIKPSKPILLTQPDTEVAQKDDNGEVLGETTENNYTNPLNNLYVNPFSK